VLSVLVLSVLLRYMDSDYPFDILKLFLHIICLSQSHISLTLFKMGMELSWQNVMYIQLIGIQCRFYTTYYNCRDIFGCIAIYLIFLPIWVDSPLVVCPRGELFM
jgi:hypothetical protein